MRASTQAWLKFGLLFIGVAAAAVVSSLWWRAERFNPSAIREAIGSFGWWAPAAYLALFTQPFIPLPGSVLMMAGGLSFGLAGGFLLAWMGAFLRACGQFLLARVCGREAIATLLRGRLQTWDQRLGESGFTAVLWIRLLPNVPYDLQNFGLGCSRIPFSSFAAATLLGLMPGALVWVYCGHALTDPHHLWKASLALLGLAAGWLLYARRRRPTPALLTTPRGRR